MTIRLERVTTKDPCRICGRTRYCGFRHLKDKLLCICMWESEGSFGVAENGGWKHFLSGGNGVTADFDLPTRDTKAPMARINAVYKEFLSLLLLNKDHTAANTARGFSIDQLNKLEYKTVEDRAAELVRLGLDLSYVPGFYRNDFGEWDSSASKVTGYFIPIRNLKQRIQAMQIRLDNGKPKYLWFSSNGMNLGATCGSPIHRSIIGFSGSGPTWITEAPLKADFISAKLGVQAIGIGGVNAGHADIVNALLEPNHRDVIIAFDGNWRSNSFVCRALGSLILKLANGVPCIPKIAVWDDDCGFDDAFQKKLDIDIISASEWYKSRSDKIPNLIKDNNLAEHLKKKLN